jgi:HAMP domain-containing protein
VKLRGKLVLSHLASIFAVAVVIGAVNLFLLLRTAVEMERATIGRTLDLSVGMLASRVEAMQDAADDIAAYVASLEYESDALSRLIRLHALLEAHRCQRAEIFRGLDLESAAYRWERGASPALRSQWLPADPRLAAQIVSGRTALWIQRPAEGTPSLKLCASVSGFSGAGRRWVVVTEPLDGELLTGLAPGVPIVAVSDANRLLASWPELPGASELSPTTVERFLPPAPFSFLFGPVIARRAALPLDDGGSLFVSLAEAPVRPGRTLALGLRAWFLIAVAGLLLAAVLGSSLASRLLAPLAGLLEGTAAMARGHLMVRLPVRRQDELGALMREFNQMAEEMRATYMGVISTLAEVVEAKSHFTRKHIERVERLTLATADVLGRRGWVRLSSQQRFILSVASILHDVGKISIPSEILNKSGPLDETERGEILTHPEVGALIVERMGKLESAADIIRCAHEHFDGSGYPRGLKGEEIPLEARIILAVDAFDAMTADRPYSSRRSIAEAVTELRTQAGRQFDPVVVEALIEVVTSSPAQDWNNSSDSGLFPLLQLSEEARTLKPPAHRE